MLNKLVIVTETLIRSLIANGCEACFLLVSADPFHTSS